MALFYVLEHRSVLLLPPLEPLNFVSVIGINVNPQKGEELKQQGLARCFKGDHRTFESLQKQSSNQPDQLSLSIYLESIKFLGIASGISQRVIKRQGEERFLPCEC